MAGDLGSLQSKEVLVKGVIIPQVIGGSSSPSDLPKDEKNFDF